jgi:uncharacterized protein YdaU (DUF1376 family)
MSEPPFLPFYSGDYLKATEDLTTLEHGAYLLLLMTIWNKEGRLPNDAGRLARIAKMPLKHWRRIEGKILDFFEEVEGGTLLRHERIDKELEKYRRQQQQHADAGRKGGQKTQRQKAEKAENDSSAMSRKVDSSAMSRDVDSSTSAKSLKNGESVEAPFKHRARDSRIRTRTIEEDRSPNGSLGHADPQGGLKNNPTPHPKPGSEFDTFWRSYPHKVGKRAAMTAFSRALGRASLDEILDGVERYRRDKPADRNWCNPATYLNEDRWTDQPGPPPQFQARATGPPRDDADRQFAEMLARKAQGR